MNKLIILFLILSYLFLVPLLYDGEYLVALYIWIEIAIVTLFSITIVIHLTKERGV